MTEQAESSTTSSAHPRRGLLYAIAAAALAAVFISLPILLLGFTIQTVASVAAGEIIAWRSSVELTYVLLAPFAILSGLALFIPFKLWQAAARSIGPSRATLWAGGLLAAALASVAMFWFLQAQLRWAAASQPEYWYALAFVAAATVILLASVLKARGTTIAAVAVLGAVAASVLVLAGALVAVWGSGPRIPVDAQTVDIISTSSGVVLEPDTVRAGPIYFLADGAGDESGHGDVMFVSAGYASPSDTPLPLTEAGIQALSLGDYQGTSIESGWAGISKLTLREGYYAFVITGVAGEQPGVAPQSIALLEVRP